ncbi:MAG TPA: hydroxysqualene dehydroxylase HpnE [Burkholderiales bacterium]|nr:hydroxysqualene dehydroxylase HpnE [Burkholderiales bacterium]
MNVAVIGGGYAGFAAAVTLADAGVAVTVYEAARELGGRARRVVVNGVALDNGLHILIGAYRETLRLVHEVHGTASEALMRLPLDWQVHRRFRLKAAPLPAPLHLALGLLTARGASWRERFAAARFVRAMHAQQFRLAEDISVNALLAAHGQGPAFQAYFWKPLCLAALNTPPAIASAQVFINVLRDGALAHRSAGDMLLARGDLSTLFPEPAANHVRAHGGQVALGSRVDALIHTREGLGVKTQRDTREYAHVICAASPYNAAALIASLPELQEAAATLAQLQYQPIYSIYLQLKESVRLPAPMVALTGLAQWVFDREAICGQRALVAAVISGKGAHQGMTQDELAHKVYDELNGELGPLPPLAWHRVIAEKRATFECSVGVKRPSTRTPLAQVHLAGDYTASDYPATLEAAVRSGIAAATQVLESRVEARQG